MVPVDGIDRIVEEGDLAGLVVLGSVGQRERGLIAGGVGYEGLDCSWLAQPLTTSRYSRSEIEKTTRMGSVWTTVASVPLCGETRLPTVTDCLADAAGDRRLDVGIGEVELGRASCDCIKSIWAFAWSTCACAPSRVACAWSTTDCDTALVLSNSF